jgi:hypothetical protein
MIEPRVRRANVAAETPMVPSAGVLVNTVANTTDGRADRGGMASCRLLPPSLFAQRPHEGPQVYSETDGPEQ